jgi:hypothetical protein
MNTLSYVDILFRIRRPQSCISDIEPRHRLLKPPRAGLPLADGYKVEDEGPNQISILFGNERLH